LNVSHNAISAPLKTFNALFLTSARDDPEFSLCGRDIITCLSTGSPIADIEFEASDFDIDEASILEVLFEVISGDVDVDLCDPFVEVSIKLIISEIKEEGYSTNGCVFRDISFCNESMALEFSALSPSGARFKDSINFRHVAWPLIFPHPRHNNPSISSYLTMIYLE
jgi:hypothetical protein